ncbi:arginine--tRNA ligase [Thermoactinomyces intermedius]|jgi:arginyl-tRNA synthetase|uniref:Arginine--tRNA ligase n=1 Tax=Thermoactinomyces intermedius TaxID=2024 RepID=A0A8I1ABK3_THEIN|nr:MULTISPECIES: arginine--tRNA ligase [Thermoactinomyces]MBA4548082.1 arginine--tRNA ligase [Thermoactinomyces intermedius]MBA4835689.1 arginine--tRNA ligase [Thermoactinomyces intermedius]MBH8594926.1 arginine--tRNA ligase [Thermoactinomyces intermedius]MBH8600414.1 arginine--tRNA ligase [Thermoactinomyces sp. CICC 23799]
MSLLEQKKEKLKQELKQAVMQAGLAEEKEIPEILLEVPREKEHGDWATNLAMQLTKVARRNPREIAAKIVEHLDKEKNHIEKIEIAGPGFINFFLDRSFLVDVLDEIDRQKEKYGYSPAGKNEKVNVEFCSANPTGSLHLGHARGSAVGDALCNLLEAAGYDVTREYYINDAGNQIHMLALSLEARYLEQLGQPVSFPENGYRGQDIIDLAKELVEQEGDRLLKIDREERIQKLREYGKKRLLDKIREDLARYRVKFDVWFSETSLYESGAVEETLKALKERGYTYEKDGALWLKSTEFGDDKDRVLIKKDGSYTYLTPDIAYHRNKFHRGFDRLINVWGADHHGYIARMKAALASLGYNPDQLEIVITQMVKLYQNGELVKMSKRTGKAVTLVDLMEEVGTDAARYFFVMRSPDTHLDFDMDLAVSKSNENPVYYVQYAHARMMSVFRQAEAKGITPSRDREDLKLLREEQEYDLLEKLGSFPGEIASSAVQLAPHKLVRYLYELASDFHRYYNAHRVISDDVNLSRARLALLQGIAQVIRNGLNLIAVDAPEQM